MTPEQILAVSQRATCLYTEVEVEAALDTMAAAITDKLANRNPLLLSVMQGAVIVTGKLATRLSFPLQMDYLHATRYRQQTRGSKLQWKHYPQTPLADRVVLIIDDILDQGNTLLAIKQYVQQQHAGEVLTAVLVHRQQPRKLPAIAADFVGLLHTDDHYLYGYGMDYKGYLRNCAGIFAVAACDCN